MEGSIIINKLIVHILDNIIQVPVLSEMEHTADSDIEEYVKGHIEQILKSDDIKAAYFSGSDNRIKVICEKIKSDSKYFVDMTCEIADTLYKLMVKYPDIPGADLMCVLFTSDGAPCLGILKLNYRDSYIHNVQNGNTGRINTVIRQKTALPSENQKVDECAIINLSDLSIKLMEKKFDINGEKDFYFSSMFLGCTSQLSDKEKVRIIKKANKEFNKKYYTEDVTKLPDMNSAIAESIEEKSAIDIVDVADNVFKRNPGMKENYIQHLKESGIDERTIRINPALSEKAFARHKIKTDTGIEINIPANFYNDTDRIEFTSNADGTISIILKNINSILDV